jgi:DNA polymerase-3 subunit alpha
MQFEKIIGIKKIGTKKTMDIEVDSKNHIFYGNGIATSNSHATIYSYLTYATAYMKCHFPSLFFTSWLHDAKEKVNSTEEKRELIIEAKRFGIQICNPTLNYISRGYGSEFFNTKDKVYFGLIDIKDIGNSQIKKLEEAVIKSENLTGKTVDKYSWFEFLCLIGSKLNKTVVNNLILVGAVPGIETRKKMSLEYKVWEKLNDKEITWITNNYTKYTSLSNSLKDYLNVDKKDGGPYNSASVKKINGLIETLEAKMYNTADDPAWISANEVNLMSVSLSSHVLDDYDSFGDTTCKEMYDGKGSGTVCAHITSVRETVTKNGKNPGQKMCFIKLEDKTDAIDGVCFPGVFSKSQDIIYVGSVVLAKVKKGQGKGVIVDSLSKA